MIDGNITQILKRYSQGEPEALEKLLPTIYAELRRLAQSYMRKENAGHTLQPTALVHEAYFRLIDQKEVQWQNRAHFFGIAAQLMRRILIDHARARKAEKRGGSHTEVAFDEKFHSGDAPEQAPDLLAIDAALEKLTVLNSRQAKVVELRYFGGLSVEEIAVALESSPATVKRDWTVAKAWLYRELSGAEEEA